MARRWLAVPVAALVLTACVAADAGTGGGVAPSAATGEVTVFAAASLTEVFDEIGRAVEAAYPGLTVTFNFAGSQQLATQIAEGAPADVFASADQAQMEAVVASGGVTDDPLVFARNRMEIAVEPGNPSSIRTLDDLARDDVTVVLAADQVPAGRYARDLLERAGVAVSPVSLEADVRGVLTKVALGEADAGIVYASDIVAAGDRVDGIAVAEARRVTATYPIAVVAGAPNPDGARLFVDAVRSDAGQASLSRYGFTVP